MQQCRLDYQSPTTLYTAAIMRRPLELPHPERSADLVAPRSHPTGGTPVPSNWRATPHP